MNATSARACFLGIDGGGTKTRFALIDGDGHLLAQAQLGTTYHPEVGLDGAADVLARGVAQVLQDAGIGGSDIGHAFFGLPAYGEDSAAAAAPAGVAPARSSATRATPATTTWSAGGPDRSAAQTASTSWPAPDRSATANATASARAGGWGEVFSDEGSAYWIAVQGLNAYSRSMSDGRAPKGPLHAAFNQALGLREDLDIRAHVCSERALTRGELAVSRRWWPRPRATATLPRGSWTGPVANWRRSPTRSAPHCISNPANVCPSPPPAAPSAPARTAVASCSATRCTPPARHSHWCPAARTTLRRRTVRPRSSPGIDFRTLRAAAPAQGRDRLLRPKRRGRLPEGDLAKRPPRPSQPDPEAGPRLRLRDTISVPPAGTRRARKRCSSCARAQDSPH